MKHAAVVLAFLAIARVACADSLEIRLPQEGTVTTAPRGTVTLALTLINGSADQRDVAVHLDLPEGWRRLIPDTPSSVPANGRSTRIVSIFIPQEAPAALYTIPVTARDASSGDVLAVGGIDVRVLAYVSLQIDSLDGSTHVLAGETIELPFRVANKSNTPLFVELSMQTRSFYPGEFDGPADGTLTIAPNESVRIVARVRTPLVVARVENYHVEVVAVGRPAGVGTGEADAGDVVRASFRSTVEIIPIVSEEPLPFWTIPARVEARTDHLFDDTWQGRASLDFAGGGYLDEQGRHKLDFRFAPSVDLDEPSLGSPDDTYRVNYTADEVAILLGDNTHAVSPLLGANLFGRGIGAWYTPGQLLLGGLYLYPRGVGPSDSSLITTVGYQGSRYRTALNVVSRFDDSLIVGSHHEYTTGADLGFEAEVAGDYSLERPLSWAATLAADGSAGVFRVGGSGLYAAPGFSGAIGDQFYLAAAANATWEESGLSIDASSSYQQRNLLRETGAAPGVLNTGLVGRLPLADNGPQITAAWRFRSRRDLMPDPAFYQILNSAQLISRMPVAGLQLTLDSKVDAERERLVDSWTWSQRHNLVLRVPQSAVTTHNVSVVLSSRRSTLSSLDRRIVLGSVTTQEWGPGSSAVSSNIAVNGRDGEFQSLVTQLAVTTGISVRASHVLTVEGFVKHEFDRTARHLTGGFAAEYSVPVRIPTAPRKGVGAVEGLAFDPSTGEPVADVVVRVADRAVVSGPEGRFRLASLQPGEYHVAVDGSRAGRGLIPDLPVPVKVTVATDESTTLDLPIVRGAAVRGSVALYAVREAREGFLATAPSADDADYDAEDVVRVGGLERVVVELSRTDELHRVLTDRNGGFEFADMRPGTWHIRVATTQLPRYHRLVSAGFEVVVASGDVEFVEFEVFPMRRPIMLLPLSSGPITLQRQHASPSPPAAAEPALEPAAATERDQYAGAQLIRLAEQRRAALALGCPRLAGLPWGSSPAIVSSILADRLAGDLEQQSGVDAGTAAPVSRFRAAGRFLLDLYGVSELSFLAPREEASPLYLSGVRLTLRGEDNGRSVSQMESVYHEIAALFASRWEPESPERLVAGTVERRIATVGYVTVVFEYDRERGTVVVEYTDQWYEHARALLLGTAQAHMGSLR